MDGRLMGRKLTICPHPGYFARTPFTVYSASPTLECTTDQPLLDDLKFLPFAEWEQGDEYEEHPDRYICYTITWKLVLNRKTVGNNLIVAPSDY